MIKWTKEGESKKQRSDKREFGNGGGNSGLRKRTKSRGTSTKSEKSPKQATKKRKTWWGKKKKKDNLFIVNKTLESAMSEKSTNVKRGE